MPTQSTATCENQIADANQYHLRERVGIQENVEFAASPPDVRWRLRPTGDAG
jgi:hypothetical protein